jgi:pimeloyl-ACP methyl ester carboxylesterase
MQKRVEEITGHYIEINDIKTYYEVIGVGKSILCLHTAGRDCRQWHFLMEYFAPRYQVIALDMPGHGKSWPLEGNTCIEDPEEYSAFIYQFIEALGIKELIFIGCSLGGNMALMMAQTYSEVIKAIVPMEGADYTPTISPGSLKLMIHPHINLHSYNMDFTSSLIGRKVGSEDREFLEWSVWQLTPQAQYGDLKAYSQFDLKDKVSEITCPVLLIRGEDDWIVDQEMVEGTRNRLTGASVVELEVLEEVGHFPHLEQPQVVCQLIDQFIEKYTDIIWYGQ